MIQKKYGDQSIDRKFTPIKEEDWLHKQFFDYKKTESQIQKEIANFRKKLEKETKKGKK